MTIRTKSTLLLIGTFALGILLGAFGFATTRSWQKNQGRDNRPREGFTTMLEQVIEPVDEAQRLQIQQVLEHSRERYRGLRNQIYSNRDSLRVELEAVLNPEQSARANAWLDQYWNRRQRGQRDSQRQQEAEKKASDS